MNKIITKNIKYFILIALLSTLFWNFIFENITALKPYEKVEIFLTVESYNEELLKNKLANNNIKGINIASCPEDDEYYMATLQTLGIISSDMLIVTDDLVLTDGSTTSFVQLEKEYLSTFNIILDDFELIYVNDNPYAIVVYDKNKNINLLEKYIEFSNEEEIYCVVLNNISCHIGKYSTQSETTTILFEMLYQLLYN